MYCNFYGFFEKPFEVTPDPKFLYLNPGHRETQASLLYGIRERKGFIAVLGEAGTGKTTLLRSVLDRLSEDVKVAYVFNTDVTFEEMFRVVLLDLGLAHEKESVGKVEGIQRLNTLAIQRLANGGNVVLMVDEAQNLDRRCMENLRLLSNLETSKNKLIQIILSGQPELEAKLRQPNLRQLSQRINLKRYILPFDEKETHEYIQHRLEVARYRGPRLFTREAEKLVWEYSGGIPRKINTVCDNSLLTGYALKKRKIEAEITREVIDDLTQNPFSEIFHLKPHMVASEAPLAGTVSGRHQSRSILSIIPLACLSLLIGLGIGVLAGSLKGADLTLLFRKTLQTVALKSQDQSRHTTIPERPADTATRRTPIPTPAMAQAKKQTSSPMASTDSTGKRIDSPAAQKKVDSPPVREVSETKARAETLIKTFSQPAPSGLLKGRTIVRVRTGDTLSAIIFRKYGRYTKELETKILETNPSIEDPHWIYIGQQIHMPDLPKLAAGN